MDLNLRLFVRRICSRLWFSECFVEMKVLILGIGWVYIVGGLFVA